MVPTCWLNPPRSTPWSPPVGWTPRDRPHGPHLVGIPPGSPPGVHPPFVIPLIQLSPLYSYPLYTVIPFIQLSPYPPGGRPASGGPLRLKSPPGVPPPRSKYPWVSPPGLKFTLGTPPVEVPLASPSPGKYPLGSSAAPVTMHHHYPCPCFDHAPPLLQPGGLSIAFGARCPLRAYSTPPVFLRLRLPTPGLLCFPSPPPLRRMGNKSHRALAQALEARWPLGAVRCPDYRAVVHRIPLGRGVDFLLFSARGWIRTSPGCPQLVQTATPNTRRPFKGYLLLRIQPNPLGHHPAWVLS